MTVRLTSALVTAWGLSGAACGSEDPATTGESGGPRVEIRVAPLSLEGVTEARYTITVATGDGVVWSRNDLTSTRYGDGRGSLSYVGPCDASAPVNTVTLVLDALVAQGTQLTGSDYVNPGPLTQDVTCVVNQDVAVVFDVTVLRNAQQGFFDVAVEFSDIFCSAKLDCERSPDQPLELLHNPATGEREQTVVVAFACTAGAGQNTTDTTDTTLYLDYIRIVCGGDERYIIDPTGGPGNMGAALPMLFQTASYRGVETLSGYEALYWNTAIGLDVEALGDDCSLQARGTASDRPFDGFATTPGSTYPFIVWDVALTGPTGSLACTSHAVNVAGSGVYTEYVTSDDAGEPVVHAMSMAPGAEAPDVVSVGRVGCGGAHFTPTADGVVVAAGGLVAGPYVLPAGYGLQDCCSDPCCE